MQTTVRLRAAYNQKYASEASGSSGSSIRDVTSPPFLGQLQYRVMAAQSVKQRPRIHAIRQRSRHALAITMVCTRTAILPVQQARHCNARSCAGKLTAIFPGVLCTCVS